MKLAELLKSTKQFRGRPAVTAAVETLVGKLTAKEHKTSRGTFLKVSATPKGSDGSRYKTFLLVTATRKVEVACTCSDYRFTFYAANSDVLAHYRAVKFAPYKSKGVGESRNPDRMPGMCKHLLALHAKAKTKGLV